MDLLYFLKVIYRKKWIIIFLTLLAVAAAFVFLFFKKPLYESKAQYSTGFTVEKVKLSEGSSMADLYAADTKFDNVIETFKSPRVIGMISYRALLHDLENPASAWKHLTQSEIESKEYKAVNKEKMMQILRDKVYANELLRSGNETERKIIDFLKLYEYDYYNIIHHLFIDRVNKTDYLNIVFRSQNPELSAWLVNAMGDEFINYYKNLNFLRTEENVSNIRQLATEQQNKIDSLNKNLLSEKINQGTIDPVSFSTSAMETVKDLEGKLAEEKSKYDVFKNRILYLKETQRSHQEVSGSNSNIKDDLLKLIDKKHKLETELVAKGGKDAEIQRQLNQLRAEINSKSSTGISSSRSTEKVEDLQDQINEATAYMNAAQTTINDYTSKINYYRGLTNLNPASGIKMGVIKSKIDIEQKQLVNLLEKLNQAEGLSKADPTANFTQTLIGQPAVQPEPKRAIVTMGISGMSMFFLVSFAFLFLEIFNASIKTPYGFEKSVKLKLVSIIDSVKLKNRSASDILLSDDVIVDNTPDGIFKNNIRKLRYEITESGEKTFLFTSTHKKTGKSTIIEALAASLLLNKKKVLIIDFNLHNNTLTQKYDASILVQDLSEKIIGNNPPLMQKVIGNTNLPNLDIIGCAQGAFTPSEILYKLDMQKLIQSLEQEYDFILMEGPSLNSYSDSKELVQFVDKVLVVFSAEHAVSQTDKVSIQFVQSLNEKNMGAVLNNVLPENINF